jgi:predicted HTH domain antitoxin
MPKRIVLEFAVEFPEEGALNKKASKNGKEAVVLELLRECKISQGKVAEFLEISRHNLFDLMAKHDIPMADFPPEELKRQLEYAEKKIK